MLRRRDGATLDVDSDLWLCALDLAVLHGWKPRGLAPPKGDDGDEDWDRYAYFQPRGQKVGRDDARDLARCLEEALGTVPDAVVPMQGAAFGRRHTLELLKRAAEGRAVSEENTRAAIEILSGPPKAEARSLVQFLRRGAFAIHAG